MGLFFRRCCLINILITAVHRAGCCCFFFFFPLPKASWELIKSVKARPWVWKMVFLPFDCFWEERKIELIKKVKAIQVLAENVSSPRPISFEWGRTWCEQADDIKQADVSLSSCALLGKLLWSYVVVALSTSGQWKVQNYGISLNGLYMTKIDASEAAIIRSEQWQERYIHCALDLCSPKTSNHNLNLKFGALLTGWLCWGYLRF